MAVRVIRVIRALFGGAKKPVGREAKVLLDTAADIARVSFAAGKNDAEIILGRHVVALEKPAIGQRFRFAFGEQKHRQRSGRAGAQHDLQRTIGMRHAHRLERRRVLEAKFLDAALPAVRVKKPDEVDHAFPLGPAENGDIQQEVVPVATDVDHGDVRRLDRIKLSVKHELAEGHAVPLGPAGVTPVDLRIVFCRDDRRCAETKRAVPCDAQPRCRHADGHPVSGGFF